MTTQKTISQKQLNKCANSIIRETSTINQVLKQFMGIYTKKHEDCEGMTTEQWMSIHGVERAQDKNGKKGHYTPATLKAGWHKEMCEVDDNGKVVRMNIFKNVQVTYKPFEDPFAPEQRVYPSKEEAEKSDGKSLTIYRQVTIGDYEWSVAKIIRGLKQGRNFEKEEKKHTMSLDEFKKLERVYISKKVVEKNDKGEKVERYVAIEVPKGLCNI